jgi:hypothetical protein
MAADVKNSATLRWIAVLPASVLAAWAAWIAVTIGNRIFSGAQGIDTDSFLFRVGVEFLAGVAMGAAFVYAGTYVAPSHKKHAAYVLAGIGLVVVGFLLFPALVTSNYWAVWGDFSAILGVAGVTYSIHAEDTALSSNNSVKRTSNPLRDFLAAYFKC